MRAVPIRTGKPRLDHPRHLRPCEPLKCPLSGHPMKDAGCHSDVAWDAVRVVVGAEMSSRCLIVVIGPVDPVGGRPSAQVTSAIRGVDQSWTRSGRRQVDLLTPTARSQGVHVDVVRRPRREGDLSTGIRRCPQPLWTTSASLDRNATARACRGGVFHRFEHSGGRNRASASTSGPQRSSTSGVDSLWTTPLNGVSSTAA